MTYNSERRIDKYTFISLMLVYFYDVFSSAALLLRQGVSGLYTLHLIVALIGTAVTITAFLNGILIKINSIGIGAAAIIHCLICIGKADKSSVALAIIITVLCMIAVNLIGKHLQLLTEETVDNK